MNGGANSRIITLGAAVVGGIVAALFLGRAVAHGDYSRVAMVIAAIFGMLVVLGLGNRYWYVIPVTLGLNLPTFQLGARNINLAEICIALCTAVFAVRFALKREKLDLFRARAVPIYLFFAWVMLVWALHPVGLAGFGSNIGGGRFYATILLAMASFLIVSNQKVEEKDIRWIFILLLSGAVLNLGRSFLEYAVLGRTLGVVQMDLDTEGTYTWHQALAGPTAIIAMVMVSRFKPSEIISIAHPGRLLGILLCFIPILLSGKRAAVAAFLMYPLVSCVIRRQFQYVAVFGVLAVGGVSVLLLGQGTYFSLPFTAQRALSWLPAQWDSDLQGYRSGQDEFRKSLREIALEEIKDDPWMGDGFRVDIDETAAAYYQQLAFGDFGDMRNQVMPYALGKAWHNTWLGYSADFGIPLAIIQAILMFTAIFMSYKAFRLSEESTWMRTMAIYCLLFFLRDLASSWTSGHSANDAFGRWWMIGMVFAMVDSLRSAHASQLPPPARSNLFRDRPAATAEASH